LKGESRREAIARLHGEDRAGAYDVEPGPLSWLLDLWQDAGAYRVAFGMAGGVLLALDWPHITAWIEGAQEHDLAPVYRRAIMALSAAYAEVAMAAGELECKAPFDPGKD
jgi:hypothetical protein